MKARTGAAWVSMVLAIAAAMALGVASAAAADGNAARVAPPGSHAYGKTLSEWLSVYLRWSFTGADPAQSMVGRVKLLPLPAAELIAGTGTPEDPALYRGQLEIALRQGTPFVLPLGIWSVERYNNGTPDDPSIPDADWLAGVSPSLYIDSKSVISNLNKAAFYVPLTAFDPIVVYPEPTSYNAYAAVAFQGYGIVSRPLPVGRHVMHLYEPVIIQSPPLSFGVIYDNTWIITVEPN